LVFQKAGAAWAADLMNAIILITMISAGNSGAEGIYTVGQPSTAVNAFSVASVENGYYVSKDLKATGVDHEIRKCTNKTRLAKECTN